MTRILIVRHGQSVWNAAGRWQGKADPPLTELGIAQARTAAAALPRFDLMAASTLQRALRTAKEMLAVHGTSPRDMVIDGRLMERDAGGFSGLTREQIDQEFPGYLDTGRWPDGWEHHDALVVRTRAALGDLAIVCPKGTVVVVSHGGVIYALESLFDLPHERISNLGGRWFELVDGNISIGDRVHLLSEADETIPDQL